jgi:hypothetical protein
MLGLGAAATALLPASGALAAALPAIRDLDSEGLVRPSLLLAALKAAESDSISARERMAVVDFKLHSKQPRLFVIDLKRGGVTAINSTHGLGSDPEHDGFAKKFSNLMGSGASSVGAYRIAGRGVGAKHGPHLALDGLEPSNDQARPRAVIIHAATYAEPDFIAQWGKMGRSNGCFATSEADRDALFGLLPAGSLLYAGA